MSTAKPPLVLENPGLRWMMSLVMVAAAVSVNVAIHRATEGRATLFIFIVAQMMVGYVAGAGPGVLALALSSLAILTLWVEPIGIPWPIERASDGVMMLLFLAAGGLATALSNHARRQARQAAQAMAKLDAALEVSQAAQRRFEVALRGGHVIAWECDADRRYTWVYNPAAGFDPSDFIGKRMGEVVPRERYAEYADAVDRAFETGQSVRLPVSFEHGGITRHYISSIEVLKGPAGEVAGLVGASLDVTELRKAQLELKLESQRKDAFLATLAHELRNPMAPIRYAAALLRDDAPKNVLQRVREVIERQSTHMSRLLDDLLDISRITRNLIELQRSDIDLCEVATHAVEAAKPLMAERGHRLTLSLPPEALTVRGDATRLHQVIGNLLDNAAKYTNPGGEIELRLALANGQAVASVKDSGMGIPADALPRVFDMFTQFHPGDGRGGLGIGLAVVRQLVELHGGTVSVKSDGPGRGTEFEVRLPVASEASTAGSAEPGKDVVQLFSDGRHVLVVDDNRDAADTLAMLLRVDGYSVSVAYNGEAALQAFEATRPALVLLDIGLPDVSGLEVAEQMRRRAGAATPRLVAVSGWGQEQDRERAKAAGFDMHLVKPVDPAELERALRALAPDMKTGS